MSSPLSGQTVLITGASMGIGRAIVLACAKAGARTLILFARSTDKLESVAADIQSAGSSAPKVICRSVDVQRSSAVNEAVKSVVDELGSASQIDVLVNNAGLALGAPSAFPELEIEDIDTMVQTNIAGLMYVTHAVLNAGGMMKRSEGTILNVTSTTGLEVPPFPGEAVYHSSKAFQEAFTNVLRTELQGTNIKVLALRPGVVETNFHEQRVGYEKGEYEGFMKGFEPLQAEEVAESAVWMLSQKGRVSVKALDVVPTAQRTLQVIDKTWNERNWVDDIQMGKRQ